ncbi:hypothetical protein [Streptomyces sp. NRRL F-5123]|uniref:hypothetical protein n=1 Tax=Streptomyces sp. NRRL F-5123 TaxID=1463856 RepID=UPI0004E18C82|nr:hypothetical protein [Streptomyces sp. NRRL F-5123]
MKIEVTACDTCKLIPAKTYVISVSDGRSIEKDLCAEHGAPLEEWLEEGELEPVQGLDPAVTAMVESAVGQTSEPAKRATSAKKAVPAKKAAPAGPTGRRRRAPKVVTLEEIEKSKRQ